MTLVRHRLAGRALFGAAALRGRPTLADLVGGADVVWLPAPAPVAPGAPYVLTVHDRSWERRPQRLQRLRARLARPRAAPRAARDAAAVTADSHAVAAELERRLGRAGHGRLAGHHGAARRERPAPPRRYLLFVGAREPRKALGVAHRAPTSARRRARPRRRARRRRRRRARGASGPGRRRRARGALRRRAGRRGARRYLEGFGLPPLEAAAHGTPAVVSDLPCFAETLGDAALRVPAGDAGALADALLRIGGDDALRARLGAAARERAAALHVGARGRRAAPAARRGGGA